MGLYPVLDVADAARSVGLAADSGQRRSEDCRFARS